MGSAALTITVNVVGITSARNVTAVQNFFFSFQLAAAGGTAPYSYSLAGGSLPNGLSLNPTTGLITGTPAALGATTVTVQAADQNGITGQSKLTITVGVMNIVSSLNVTGIEGQSFHYQANTSGGNGANTYAFIGTLPTGLSLNDSNGQITGTPTATGTFSGTLSVVDTSNPTPNMASATLTITIGTIGINNGPTFAAIQGVSFSATLNASGGTSPYTYALASGGDPSPRRSDPEVRRRHQRHPHRLGHDLYGQGDRQHGSHPQHRQRADHGHGQLPWFHQQQYDQRRGRIRPHLPLRRVRRRYPLYVFPVQPE